MFFYSTLQIVNILRIINILVNTSKYLIKMLSLLAYILIFDYVSELKFRTHLFTFLVIIMVHNCLLIAFETIEI